MKLQYVNQRTNVTSKDTPCTPSTPTPSPRILNIGTRSSPQFYIQDTKSSNGTFVNETRLSPSGEESAPVELKSRDVVQFGVNVNVEKRGRFIRAPRKRRLRGVFKIALCC